MSTEEKTSPRRLITEEKKLDVFDPKSTKNQLRTSLRCRSTRNDMKFSGMSIEDPSGALFRKYGGWAGAQRKNCVIIALPLSPEGFELPCAHRLDPMTI